MICEQSKIEGSGKGTEGWFPLKKVNVSYDHPFNAPWEYGVNIDFITLSVSFCKDAAISNLFCSDKFAS